MRTIATAVIVLSCVACATPPRAAPVTVRVDDRGAAYDKALRMLVSEGLSVEVKDRDAGVIVTEWAVDTDAPVAAAAFGATRQFRVRVVVADVATVTSEIRVCTQESGCGAPAPYSTPQANLLVRRIGAAMGGHPIDYEAESAPK